MMTGKAAFVHVTAVAFVCMVFLGAARGVHPHAEEKFTRHYADSLFKVTEKGLFSVELVILGKEFTVGKNSADIIVHDQKDVDVMGAEIRIRPWMPDMGHGVSVEPVVTERGGGLYSVEDIAFSMPGRWELWVEIKKGDLGDEAVFEFPHVEKAEHEMEHEHRMMKPAADLDYSRTRPSDKGLFKVSFESEIDPIAINRFHSWRITIKTAKGVPVQDAEITVDGDMPEHGHGMPTQPWVTENLGDGQYLVEGMKFQMPGWWVVNFRIEAEDKEDTVTFNLQLQ